MVFTIDVLAFYRPSSILLRKRQQNKPSFLKWFYLKYVKKKIKISISYF